MKAPLVALASALLLAGNLTACSSKVPAEVGAIVDRACACQTKDCAAKVEKEYMDYAKANPQVKGTKEERDEVQDHYNRMRECLARARGAAPASGAASTPAEPAGKATGAPPAPAPATPAPATPAAPAETK